MVSCSVLHAALSSRAAGGSRGLLCFRCWVWIRWRRGTREEGGLWTLSSSAVSMDSAGSRISAEDVSLCVDEEKEVRRTLDVNG